jgi:hypothetical protein
MTDSWRVVDFPDRVSRDNCAYKVGPNLPYGARAVTAVPSGEGCFGKMLTTVKALTPPSRKTMVKPNIRTNKALR